MSDMLQTGSAWLEAQRHAHLAHPVIYERSGVRVALEATVGRTAFEVETDHGVESWESRDFLLRASDLVMGGERIEPARGDRIKETIDGTTQVFEVMSPGGEPPFRYSDPGRKTLRIHTKQVDTE